MPINYADMQLRVLQLLQASTAEYSDTSLGYWMEDELKRLSRYDPHIVDVIFQIESRIGVASATTATKLTDATKDQFLAADATNEKVVHNITDDTWTVVKTHTDAENLVLTNDIFLVNDEYEIFNKRCKNKRQIYIGDMPLYMWVDSVEYPIGTERNFTILDDVLELDVVDDVIQDSDSTNDPLSQVDVLVRFTFPHILSQLTDWAGTIAGTASVAGTVSITIADLAASASIEVGEQFNLADMYATYIIAATATANSAGAATITFYPGLESAAASASVITFKKSTLQPQHEELLCRMVAVKAVSSDSIAKINKANVGGGRTWADFMQWAQSLKVDVDRDLRKLAKPKSAKIRPRT